MAAKAVASTSYFCAGLVARQLEDKKLATASQLEVEDKAVTEITEF